MAPDKSPVDFWRWPSLLLWLAFFVLGLWPELTFDVLRSSAHVFTQNAIINSYNFITWSLTGFVGYFVYHRCIEAELPPVEALGKSVQLGVLAFVAFIDLPIEQIPEIRNAADRALVMGTIGLKLLVWLYLYSLILRYYWTHNARVIAGALPYFALTLELDRHRAGKQETGTEAPADDSSSVKNPAD